MLELNDFMPIGFLKKERFTGSHKGMRFAMEKVAGEAAPGLGVTVWPEPYGYDATPDSEKERILLEFNEEGLEQGVAWINEQYKAQKDRWKAAAWDGSHT